MKYYHMIIGKKWEEEHNDKSTWREYISRKQGSAPQGWVCLGVCGFHEETKSKNRASIEIEERP